jgi:aryl sulfotransferase
MGMKGGIVWLASYPKSGNTWLRLFIANLQGNGMRPVDINKLDIGLIASFRNIFDESIGIESSDLTTEEIERLRPEVYEHLAELAEEMLFIKIHDACTYTDKGRPLVPAQATRGVIYLIRNPLDVAVSLAHHKSLDYDSAIDCMANNDFCLSCSAFRLHDQLPQRLLSWSDHVMSWLNSPVRLLVLRYEDMQQQSLETFTQAAQFVGLPVDPERVGRALEYCDFKELQRQEQEYGFKERSPKAQRFFREGTVGAWRRELTPEQVHRIIQKHHKVMEQFGYLGEDGRPLP